MQDEGKLLYGPNRSPRNLSEYRDLPVKLHRTREALGYVLRAPLQRYQLTDPQWRVLRILSTVDEIDTALLAKRSMLLGPSLSRILPDLRKRKLIASRASASDKRRVCHSITRRAVELIDRVAPQFNPFYAELARRVSDKEMSTLNSMLDKLYLVLGDIGRQQAE